MNKKDNGRFSGDNGEYLTVQNTVQNQKDIVRASVVA